MRLNAPGSKPGLAQYLKTVADADYQSTRFCKLPDGAHNWRKSGDGSSSKVIPVEKTTGYYDGIVPGKIVILVPDIIGFLSQRAVHCVVTIGFAPGA